MYATASLNLITALIHTIMGHYELILPFTDIDFPDTLKAILHACWHMVTTVLFFSSLVFYFLGHRPQLATARPVVLLLGLLYIIFSMAFLAVSIGYNLFLPQILLLLPIGLMAIFGAKGMRGNVTTSPRGWKTK